MRRHDELAICRRLISHRLVRAQPQHNLRQAQRNRQGAAASRIPRAVDASELVITPLRASADIQQGVGIGDSGW